MIYTPEEVRRFAHAMEANGLFHIAKTLLSYAALLESLKEFDDNCDGFDLIERIRKRAAEILKGAKQ